MLHYVTMNSSKNQSHELFYTGLILFIFALLIFNQLIMTSDTGTSSQNSPDRIKEDTIQVDFERKIEILQNQEQLKEKLREKPLPYLGLILLILAVMILIVLSLPALIIYIVLRAKGKDPLTTEPRLTVPWGFRDVFKSMAVYLLIILFTQAIFRAVLSIAPGSLEFIRQYRLNLNLATMMLAEISLVLFCFYLVVRVHGSSLDRLGLTLKDLRKNIFRGGAAYVVFAPILIVTIIFSSILTQIFGQPSDAQTMMELLSPRYGFWHVLFGLLAITLIGPIVEEIFFRGFFQSALRKWLSFWPAIIMAALIFAFLHFRFTAFPTLFALGLLLAYVYEKTQSLVPAITIHIIHNSIFAFYMLLFSLL